MYLLYFPVSLSVIGIISMNTLLSATGIISMNTLLSVIGMISNNALLSVIGMISMPGFLGVVCLLSLTILYSIIECTRNELTNVISRLNMPNTINLTGKEEATHELV